MFIELLGQSAGVGAYLAIWKVLIFVVFFGAWAWVGQWVDTDTEVVHTKRAFWNNIYLGVGLGGLCLWLLMPAPFLVNFLIFLVFWLTVSITYVVHRNARVSPELKILTVDHIKDLLESDKKKTKTDKRLTFISSNKNELPMPKRQEKEYPGYMVAVELVNDVWNRRASKVELAPTGENYQVRYVVDGVASIAGERERRDAEECLNYLKAVGGMETEERRRPQSGHFSTSRLDSDAKWSIKTAGSTRGEHMVLEKVQEAQALKLDELGLTPDQLERMKEYVAAPAGVVLICGTRGSGLTTTLYSLTRRHDPFMQHIHTLERSIIIELDNISQHEVEQSADGKAMARQLQSVLRGDPDIMMVGFCENAPMAHFGSRAAAEGKKLYYGLSEPTTFHGLQRWLKWVNDHELAAQTLLAVVSQRLLRKLCLECREAYAPDGALLKKLNLPADKIKQFYRAGEIEYDKRGRPLLCTNCQGTGYFGRTAVFETLFVSESLRQLIRAKAPINNMRAQCRKEKMLYLQEEALRKVIDGTTSIQEVLRVTTEAAAKGARRTAEGGQKPKGK